MKKEDLKDRMVIETREGNKYLIKTGYNPMGLNCNCNLIKKCINDDLTNEYKRSDIMKIYEDYTLTNLLWERPEPKPELSAKERNILVRALSEGYRWIARDKNNAVWLFDVKPYKLNACDEEIWSNGIFNEKQPLTLCKDLFTFIRWEDKQPRKIKDLLIVEE